MRIGLIGCGDWGSTLARALSGMGALHAVCDADTRRAAKLASDLDVAAPDFDTLLRNPGVDALVLALPARLQTEMALEALRAGKHVLIEKPMALTLNDAKELVDAARISGLVAMTGHLLRFHPGFEALMSLVRDAALGPIRHIRSTRAAFGKFYQDVDALWDIAPHELAMHLALSGQSPATTRVERVALTPDAVDMADLRLTYPSGVSSHIHVSRISPQPERRLTLIGDTGTAVFDDLQPAPRKVALYRHPSPETRGFGRMVPTGPDYIDLPDRQPLQTELAHFIDCMHSNRTPVSSVAEGLHVLRVLAEAV